MLSLSDIMKMKKELNDVYGAQLHFHDVCPKPFFTLDKTNDEIKNYIYDFLRAKNLTASFSDDDTHFTVEKNKQLPI